MLRRCVAAAAGVNLEAGCRTDIDDVTAWRPAEQGKHRAGHAEEPEDVGFDHLDPILIPALCYGILAEGDSRIVDENIDVAEAFPDLRHEAIDARVVRQVKV
jgi:hypothetical protein